MHRQRIWILVGVVVVLAGCLMPWAHLGNKSYNVFDHEMFRILLVALLAGVIPLTVFGKRRTRVTGAALGTLVVIALLIAGIAALLAYSLASSQFLAWRLGWGILVTLLGCALLVVAGALVGRNDFQDPDSSP